jgi:signal transduction histidine kinase
VEPRVTTTPSPARRRRHPTVRGTILRTVVLLTLLTLVTVGLTAVWLERNRIVDSVDATLTRTTREMAALLADESVIPPGTPISDAVYVAIESEIPADNEGALGFVGTDPVWAQAGGLDMLADPALVDALTDVVAGGEGTLTSVTTSLSTYRFAVLPIAYASPDGGAPAESPSVDTGDPAVDPAGSRTGPGIGAQGVPTTGAVVVAFDLDAELAPADASARTYAALSVASMVIVGIVAWVVSGRLLAPLRDLRRTAEQISESDLSGRIAVNGSDDVAELTRTVNAMLGRLEASFVSQRRLLDDAGHELRTPITIVRGHLELMDPADPDDARQTRDLAISELDRMRRLTDDLVMLAKADSPQFVSPRPTALGPLLDNALDQVRPLGDRRFVVDARLEAEASVDPQRLTQALIQLAANAVKFSEPGTQVALGSAIVGGRLRLWVRDEGRGIAEDDLEDVFQRFGRGTSPGADQPEGAGLGLAIVRAIAHGHDGEVSVRSRVGVGSTFTLDLPAVDLTIDTEPLSPAEDATISGADGHDTETSSDSSGDGPEPRHEGTPRWPRSS